jgi:pimeloyl-ACP methyl ester carboxylesterase
MLADLVEVTTADGIPLNGAYFAPTVVNRPCSIDALCFFHGDTGHFYRRLYLELGARMAAQGVAFLTANRRGHDIVSNGARGGSLQGYAHESVEQSRLDYAAWLTFLRARGHRTMALGGHSGGAVRAVYAQSTAHFEDVAAVVAVSPGEYNHKGLIDLHGDAFVHTYSQAQTHVTQGQPEVYLRPGMPFGATWSASAFVDCFHVDNRYSVSARAADTSCPTLFVFGAEECCGPQELPLCGAAMRRLKEAAYAHVTVEVIDGANHGYENREMALFETIMTWLTVACPRMTTSSPTI